MREQLLPDTDGLILQKTRSTPLCSYSGRNIARGVHAISLRQFVNGETYIAWLSVGSADDVIDLLHQFDADDYDPDPKVSIAPSDRIKYGVLKGSEQTCVMCEEDMEMGELGICFSRPMSQGIVVWMHTDCRDQLIEGLERIWDYSDELLAEQV